MFLEVTSSLNSRHFRDRTLVEVLPVTVFERVNPAFLGDHVMVSDTVL